MIGREGEVTELRISISNMIAKKISGSFYLSGPPGTGKTATVQYVLDSLSEKHDYDRVYVNCMSVRKPGGVYQKILENLTDSQTDPRSCRFIRQMIARIENLFIDSTRSMYNAVVLDEIDQLETKNHNVLYTSFGWVSSSGSKLILIGIANSLDLTERILPKLKLDKFPPRLIHFCPYDKDQVLAILRTHLQSDIENSHLDPTTIELCARKIAATTGDIRRAFDLCRRLNSNPSFTPSDMLTAVQSVYGSPLVQMAVDLPLQQKLLLAAMVALVGDGRPAPTVTKLHAAYKRACRQQDVPPVDESDAVSMCDLLEAHGFLRIVVRMSGRKPSPAIVQLLVDEQSVRSALSDEALFKAVLAVV